MAGFEIPRDPLTADGGRPMSWLQVFSRWHRVILALQQSGATADRPEKLLWVGRFYFDTDLGHPIWVSDPTPGAVVWVDAAGNAV